MKRYYIRIQQRCAYNGLFDRNDWREYRKYSAWPITFTSRLGAEMFMRQCFTFRNLGRKSSASVELCHQRRPTCTL